MRYLRWLKYILYAGVIFLLTLLLGLAFMLSSEPGLKMSFSLVEKLIPGEISADHIEGSLLGQFELRGFSYEDDYVSVKVDRSVISIQPWTLLSGHLQITEISLDDTTVLVKPRDQQKDSQIEQIDALTPDKQFFMPVQVEFPNIAINQLSLQLPNNSDPIIFNDIQINGSSNLSDISLEQFSLHDKDYQLFGYLDFSWIDLYPSSVQLTIHSIGNTQRPFTATLSANGFLNDYQFSGEVLLQDEHIGQQQIALTGHGNLEGIILETIEDNTQLGTMSGNGQLDWTPNLHWQANLKIEADDLYAISPYLTGTLAASIFTEGSFQNEQLETELKVDSIEGELNDSSLSGNIDLSYDKNGLDITQINMYLGDNEVNIYGQANKQLSLSWSIQGTNLSQIIPQMQGELVSEGHISGSFKTPIIHAKSEVTDFKFDDIEIAALQQHLQLDLSNNQPAIVNLIATDLAYQQYSINEFMIGGSGTLDEHRIRIDIQSDDFNHKSLQLQTDVVGQYQNEKWTGVLQNVRFNFGESEPWSLQSPAFLQLSKEQFDLSPICLQSAEQQICLSSHLQNDQSWHISLSIDNFDSDNLPLVFPENIEVQTDLNLAIELDGQNNIIHQGHFNLAIEPGLVIYHDNLSPRTIFFLGGQLQGNITDQDTQLELLFQINQENRIQGEITLPGFHHLQPLSIQQAIDGALDLRINDMRLFSDFVPQIDIPNGTLHGRTMIGGTVATPDISGNVALNIPELAIRQLGLTLIDIELQLNSDNNQDIQVLGHINSGEGQLTINGNIQLPYMNTRGELMVSGENFQVINNEEYQVVITPSLRIRLNGNLISVNGDVLVPQAMIQPSHFTDTIVLPDDVVFVDEQEQQSIPFQFSNHINVRMGDNVHIDVMGLSARLQGELTIEDHPNQLDTASGEISMIDGEFNILGQTLQIERGHILYGGGPIDSPDIDLRATRTFDNVSMVNTSLNESAAMLEMQALPTTMQNLPSFATYTVGIQVTGPANNPHIELFSDPSTLDQADILSLLLFGTTLSSQSGGNSLQNNAGALIQAASTLNIGGFQFSEILGRVRNTLGFSEIELQRQQIYDPTINQITNATALVLGRTLTSHLFVNYSFRLFDNTNILRLSYLFNNNWSIQSITDGTNNGIDLLFTIER